MLICGNGVTHPTKDDLLGGATTVIRACARQATRRSGRSEAVASSGERRTLGLLRRRSVLGISLVVAARSWQRLIRVSCLFFNLVVERVNI